MLWKASLKLGGELGEKYSLTNKNKDYSQYKVEPNSNIMEWQRE